MVSLSPNAMSTSRAPFFCLIFLFSLLSSSSISATGIARLRELFLVQQPPLVLEYHGGLLLKGPYTVNLVWYGVFTPVQRAVVSDFIESLTPVPFRQYPPPPSVASWWSVTESYGTGSTTISIGLQVLHDDYDLGRSLTLKDLETLARTAPLEKSINVVLTAADVTVDGFCRSSCGLHDAGTASGPRFPYIWVGNSATQCPGQCAWPFAQPYYGPQVPPLLPPNADVGVDGMIVNLATLLAGTVTNPFDGGYFQGPATAPLEAVTACPGMFGKGSYPGYAGEVLIDVTSGSSYNARGLNGREYLLPAMWDPKTSKCTTLV